MKKYYSLMIVVLAFVTGTTGCLVQATKYGIPDHEYVDENHETPDESDEIQTDTDINDVDVSDIDADKIEPDEDVPASKYGVQYTDYDSN